jgi:hypothetical protein
LGSGYGKLACFVRIAAVVTLASGMAADATPSKGDVLKRAAAYVDTQADLLPQLVAEERSRQKQEPRFRADDVTVSRLERETWADFAWVRIEGLPDALGVRDVRAVDGQPVGNEGRLERLLRIPMSERFAAVQKLLAESARYNLAPGSRNMNLPTFALFLLHRTLQPRFSWKMEESEGRAVVLAFKERDRPTVIRGPRLENVFCQGRVWIDPATGEIRRTELRAQVGDPGDGFYTTYFLAVDFANEPSLQILLPRHLRERYETRMTIVTGDAEYVNYRRFQTGGRLVK